MAKILIGIDCGVNTGVCVLQDGKFLKLEAMKIHNACYLVDKIDQRAKAFDESIHVFVEDARKRGANPYDKNSHFKQQGAGSVKRDAKIWEDFLNDLGVPFTLVSPLKNKTKLTHEQFCKRTGWSGGKTNEHMRDAAMLLF